jgi:competence protein ComEA
MYKTILIIIAITLVVIIAMAVVDKVSGDIADPASSVRSLSEDDTLQVTITGEVAHTGVYYLPLKSTLADLCQSAGEVSSNADPKAYNTSYLLKDKQTFYIAPIYDNGDTCQVSPINKVNINTADKATLMAMVKVFSSSLADKIIAYRTANGQFMRIEDLESVGDIGPATFEKCKNLVILHD